MEYALAGMDNGLFVSKYQLELPSKDEIQQFIEEQMKEAKRKLRNYLQRNKPQNTKHVERNMTNEKLLLRCR